MEKLENLILSPDTHKITDNFLKLLKGIINYKGYALLIINEETNQFDFRDVYNLSKEKLNDIANLIEKGIIDWALKRGNKPILIPFKMDTKQALKEDNFLILPLISADKEVGVITILCSIDEKSLNQQKIDLLTLFAAQFAIKVENLKLRLDNEHRRQELSTLLKSSEIITSSLERDGILRLVLNLTLKEIKSEYGFLLFPQKKEHRLIPGVSSGIPLSKVKKEYFIEGKGALGWVAKNSQPLIIDNYKKDARFRNSREFIFLSPETLLIVPLNINKEIVSIMVLCNVINKPFYTNNDLNIALIFANYAAMVIKNRALYDNLHQSFLGTINALVKAIDAKDKYTRGHSQKVTVYALHTAQSLGLSKEKMEMVRFCGLLHDIGKIGIQDKILHKPSKLTPKEYEAIKKHPIIGEKIIKDVKFLQKGGSLIRHHHEHYDGSGYPDGLKGEKIPLLARIVTVADAFAAMTSDRPYRKALSTEEAIKELQKGAGTQFDPKIVKVFLKTIKELKS